MTSVFRYCHSLPKQSSGQSLTLLASSISLAAPLTPLPSSEHTFLAIYINCFPLRPIPLNSPKKHSNLIPRCFASSRIKWERASRLPLYPKNLLLILQNGGKITLPTHLIKLDDEKDSDNIKIWHRKMTAVIIPHQPPTNDVKTMI